MRRLAYWIATALVAFFLEVPDYCDATIRKKNDLEVNVVECLKGRTIYCIAAGIDSQRTGDNGKALDYFRLACQAHSAKRTLRACTPYLMLAKKLGRLESSVAGLESLCGKGHDVICFYLAKEYLKISESVKGQDHFERLCRKNYRPPQDSEDYGPCYHLAISFWHQGFISKAGKFFRFDCRRDPELAKLSCEKYQMLKDLTSGALVKSYVARQPAVEELWLIGMILISFLSLIFLVRGRPLVLKTVRLVSPFLILACWLAWELGESRELYPPIDITFIAPVFLLMLALVGMSNWKLKNIS